MNLFLNILGITVGILLTIWSIWLLKEYSKLPSSGKKLKRSHLYLGILILLIGLADISKGIKDFIKDL